MGTNRTTVIPIGIMPKTKGKTIRISVMVSSGAPLFLLLLLQNLELLTSSGKDGSIFHKNNHND